MLFNSIEFLIFLPCIVILYYQIPNRLRWVLLLGASYLFYMAWKPEYIILILISTLIDYSVSILMEKQTAKSKRKALLLVSLFTNLGLLFIFKYFNFLNIEIGNVFTHLTNKEYPIASFKLLLPMGISFYTFQTLSYTIDVYRGNRKAERHLGYFALYVTFFPQLVAGPIERSDKLLPQLKIKHQFDFDSFMEGILRISWGFFKKVVIADRVAVLVNTVYNNVDNYSGVYLIIATIGFAIQIYCDFSAYSDIAIGSAKLMGINLMENFKTPYFSKSISEFWSRWHISLSSWFKDYLYIPLGGNRVNKRWKYYRNLLIVFLVSGVWHGANWTFVVWGFLHGIFQVFERALSHIKIKRNIKCNSPAFIRTTLTLVFVLFTWIFFRANSMHDAALIVSRINFSNMSTLFDGQSLYSLGLDIKDLNALIISCSILLVIDWLRYKSDSELLTKNYFMRGLVSIALIIIVIVFGYYGAYEQSQFVYFRF